MNMDRARIGRLVHYATFAIAIFALGASLAAWLLPPRPADAIGTSLQMLTGGNSQAQMSGIRFTAPGLGNQYSEDFPDVALGERAAQIRVPAGIAMRLRVRLTTATAPTSGSFIIMLRRNANDTTMTCTIDSAALATLTANCHETATTVAYNVGDRMTVMTNNTLADTGNLAYSYVFEYD